MLDSSDTIGTDGPRELVARLAAAVLIADGRISEAELRAVERLRELGLGPLSAAVDAEIQRAVHTPIDVAGTAAALAEVAPHAGDLAVSALAQIAASDREISLRELEVLTLISEVLGLDDSETAHAIRSAAAHYGAAIAPSRSSVSGARGAVAPPPAAEPLPASQPAATPEPRGVPQLTATLSLLGLAADATAEDVDVAYAALVRRYNPAAMIELGPEFAVLAVQKLSAVTTAYVAAHQQLAGRGTAGER